ncbi:hypothetical protein FRB99_002334 [Tulasnella sp. 403]|nr:hypothetical protein FRB99_002334 [Tulasnella sp. 403]
MALNHRMANSESPLPVPSLCEESPHTRMIPTPKYPTTQNYAIAKRRNALLPIHTLPVELFCTILKHVVDSFPGPIVASLQGLASVSTFWWSVVITNPTLWTLVHHEDNVSLVLRKSQDCPIDIHFAPKRYRGHNFVDLVGPYAKRWRSLYFNARRTPVTVLVAIAELLKTDLPLLERLLIMQDNLGWRPKLQMLINAPRLRDVHLDCVCVDPSSVFTNLTSLTLDRCYGTKLSNLTRLLIDNPDLEELCFSFQPDETQGSGLDEPVGDSNEFRPLKNLRSLNLSGSIGMRSILAILRLVKVEALKMLCIAQSFDPLAEQVDWEGLRSYISAIAAALTVPRIQTVWLDIVAGHISLFGSRTNSDGYSPPSKYKGHDVILHFYNLGLGVPNAMGYILSAITNAISVPLFLRLDPMWWIPDPPAFSKLPTLSRMEIVTGMNLGNALGPMFNDLATPHTRSDGVSEWLCPQLSRVGASGSFFEGSKLEITQFVENRRAAWEAHGNTSTPPPCLSVDII